MGNLNLDQVTAAQSNKETTINDADAELEDALTNLSQVLLTGMSSPITLTTAQWLWAIDLQFTGAPGGAFTAQVPVNNKLAIVENLCTDGSVVTVKTVAGTGIALNPGDVKLLYCDGTNVVCKASFTVFLSSFYPGTPPASASTFRIIAPFNFTIKEGLPGAQATFTANPTANPYTVTFTKNNVSFGTLAISSVGGLTWTAASDTSFLAGTDVLSYALPGADATLKNLAISLGAVRTS